MRMSRSGFLRPVPNAELNNETSRLIAQVCPGIRLEQNASREVDHPLWGPIRTVRTGKSTDSELCHHASSGGVLSALMVHLLESKAIDYVVQIAADPQMPVANMVVESVSSNDVFHAAGSRYAPSAPLEKLHEYLSGDGRFAIVGKPCDISAARAFGRHDPRVAEKVVVFVSFFCAGVPSIEGAREVLDRLDVAEDDVLSFRYRGDGWPGTATARLHDDTEASMSYAASWGEILSGHVQFRCKICPDGSGGFADIVCGDAWHCDEHGYPLFEEQQGRSLIITRSSIGEDIVCQALEGGYITAEPLDVSEVEQMQPSQARRKRLILSRLFALAILERSYPTFRGLNLFAAAMSAGLWPNIKSFLGMARRIVLGKK